MQETRINMLLLLSMTKGFRNLSPNVQERISYALGDAMRANQRNVVRLIVRSQPDFLLRNGAPENVILHSLRSEELGHQEDLVTRWYLRTGSNRSKDGISRFPEGPFAEIDLPWIVAGALSALEHNEIFLKLRTPGLVDAPQTP